MMPEKYGGLVKSTLKVSDDEPVSTKSVIYF